jgi:molybdate transport system substrate-binding protein
VRILLAVALSVTFLFPATARGQETLLVAAASDLQFVLPGLVQQFEKDTGAEVKLVFGSSGNFTTQIRNGAPYDFFFSADLNYPRQLEREGFVEPGTVYHYADGKIVLWVSKGSGFDPSKGLSILLLPEVKKISIANPEHAPYGRAAVAALKAENLFERVKPKLILGENISQAAQFVQSGSAEVGIIALSLALAPAMQQTGKFAEIPQRDYPAIEQACAVLKSSYHKQLAERFLAFIKRSEVKSLLTPSGFVNPR